MMSRYFQNTKNNVNKILNRYHDGYHTLILNAPCQSGKTDVAPCLQEHMAHEGSGLFIPVVSDNHLYDENERAIIEKNPQVGCEKLSNLVNRLENGEFTDYAPFFVFDEAHVGHKVDSKFNKAIILINKFYKKQKWGRPFYIFQGATNWQLMHLHNHGNLNEETFGRVSALDLEVGEGYYGAQQFLDHKNIIFKEPVDEINKLQNGNLHPSLREELDRLISKDLDRTLKEEFVKDPPIGLIRVSKSANDGQQIVDKINNVYQGKIEAYAVNSIEGSKIKESYDHAIRRSYSKPVVIVACQGLAMGIKINPSVKKRIAFCIEDRKVMSAIAQSLLGRFMGYRDIKNPFPIPCNIYVDQSVVEFLANFDKDSAYLNDVSIENFPFIGDLIRDIQIATHFNATSHRKNTKTDLYYAIAPNNIESDSDIRCYFQDKYINSLRISTTPTFSFERYQDVQARGNDIQKILLEEGEKGGGNRLTRFHDPRVESKNPESEQNLKRALEDSGHSLTKKILDYANITHQELLRAFDGGRLFRVKITLPNNEVATKVNNKSFCASN